MTAKPNCTRSGRCAGGNFQQRRRILAPIRCSVGCPEPRYVWGGSAGDSGHYSPGFAELQRRLALLVVDRLLQREDNQVPAKASDQDRRPIFVVSDLNSDNTARRELFKLPFELARAFFYLGKFPEDLAVRIENGWAIFCAAQRLFPAIE